MRKNNYKIYCTLIIVCLLLSLTMFFSKVNLFCNSQTNNYEALVKLKNDCQIYHFKFSFPISLADLQSIKQTNEFIEQIEINQQYEISLLPNDFSFSQQKNLSIIRAPQAWDLASGGNKNVVIAVIDTGVDIDHPDLKNNIWTNSQEIPNDGIDNDHNGYIDDIHGWDFIQQSANPSPKLNVAHTVEGINHGTIVAGLISAQGDNNQGALGVAWRCKIMPLRVLSGEGKGRLSEVIEAIDYARQMGADIINLSFAGLNDSVFLDQAIDRAWQNGALIVAAAGNYLGDPNGLDLNEYPAYPICSEDEHQQVLGVSGVDDYERKLNFVNYGSRCVDLVAPADQVYSTMVKRSGYQDFQQLYGGGWSGSSVAAPIVSGIAALIKSVNPQLSNQDIRQILLEQAKNIEGFNANYVGQLGQGRVTAYQSVKYAYEQAEQTVNESWLLVGAGTSGGAHVRIFQSNGVLTNPGWFVENEKLRGGVNVASGDLNGDGRDEIITGPISQRAPLIRIFDQQGNLLRQFLAYDSSFRGGVNIASGDLDGDKQDEIITSPGPGNEPLIKIFDQQGNLLRQFLAYDSSFRGGVNIATGDFDIDGQDEIITGAGSGGGPHVRVFDGQGNFRWHFFAFAESFRGGVKVAAGDTDGDGKDNLIVSIASQSGPFVRVFDESANLKSQFLAYDASFYGGVNVATAKLDKQSSIAKIITSPIGAHSPQVRIFDQSGKLQGQFYAYSRLFTGGVNVSAMAINE